MQVFVNKSGDTSERPASTHPIQSSDSSHTNSHLFLFSTPISGLSVKLSPQSPMASANTSEDGSMYADKETDSEIWSLKAQLMTNLPILMNLPWGKMTWVNLIICNLSNEWRN